MLKSHVLVIYLFHCFACHGLGPMGKTENVGRLNFPLEDITSVERNFFNRVRFVQLEKVIQWEAIKYSSSSSTPPWLNRYVTHQYFDVREVNQNAQVHMPMTALDAVLPRGLSDKL